MAEESIQLSCIRAKVVEGATPLVYSDGEHFVLEVCEPRKECGFKAKIALRFLAVDSMLGFLESALNQTHEVSKLYGHVTGDA